MRCCSKAIALSDENNESEEHIKDPCKRFLKKHFRTEMSSKIRRQL